MRVAAICNRTTHRAHEVFRHADAGGEVQDVGSAGQLDDCVRAGVAAVLQDVHEITAAETIDVVVDATGALEYGARVALAAIDGRKHLVLLNAELDATVGPVLKTLATERGVVTSAADGDQPGVQLNLYDFARQVGLVPRVLGNIKGFHDVRRTPTTQRDFAARWGQRPDMVTSFADGTKVNFEQCVVANATGFSVPQVGMLGRDFSGHVDDLVSAYDLDELRERTGVVDYVVGAAPAPGVFCLAEAADRAQKHYLELFKLGAGPLYSLYVPYHLCHLEVPTTIARVVGFADGMQPLDRPYVEVCCVAKTDIEAGRVLDGCGGYLTYGKAMNSAEFARGGFLPMGVAEGCVVGSDLPRDHLLTYDDVQLPEGRLIDTLRRRQAELF